MSEDQAKKHVRFNVEVEGDRWRVIRLAASHLLGPWALDVAWSLGSLAGRERYRTVDEARDAAQKLTMQLAGERLREAGRAFKTALEQARGTGTAKGLAPLLRDDEQ